MQDIFKEEQERYLKATAEHPATTTKLPYDPDKVHAVGIGMIIIFVVVLIIATALGYAAGARQALARSTQSRQPE